MRLFVEPVRARLRAPFTAAWGTVADRELLLVRLEDSRGNAGWGEAAPLPDYGGASAEQVRAGLERCGAMLADADGATPAQVLSTCAAMSPPPEALAAIDLALWDLEGRRRGRPVADLLAASEPRPVKVNAMISSTDPGAVAAEVERAGAAGFRCVKLKVAIGGDEDRVAAARQAGGSELAIRVDANRGWSEPEAVSALRALARFGLELCEEPVHGLEAIARVSADSAVPVALDESAAPAALRERVCDAVCLKVARCGGIAGLLTAAGQARAAGYRVYLASTLDGPLGIAAALHAAAAVRPDLPCGLATLGMFAAAADPLPPHGGEIEPPPGPGLGDGLLEWYGGAATDR